MKKQKLKENRERREQEIKEKLERNRQIKEAKEKDKNKGKPKPKESPKPSKQKSADKETPAEIPKKKTLSSGPVTWDCGFCGKKFENNQQFYKHLFLKHQIKGSGFKLN